MSASHFRAYYALFGRYEGSRQAPAPRHAFLVGHERERAHLLDLLYMKSDVGSYLITGPRGVGKTTFVRHCVDTYVRDVYERYSRSYVARSRADKCTLVGLTFLVLLVFFAAAHLATNMLGALELTRGALGSDVMRLLVILTCIAACCAPTAVAVHEHRDLECLWTETPTRRSHDNLLAGALLAGFLVAVALAVQGCLWQAALTVLGSTLCLHYFALQPGSQPSRPGDLASLGQRVADARVVALLRVLVLHLLAVSALAPAVCVAANRAWRLGLRLSFPAPWLARTVASDCTITPNGCWYVELTTAALWTGVLAALLWVEREDVLQPSRRILYEPAFGGAAVHSERYFEMHHRLSLAADHTVFHRVFSAWLPIIRVPVNLGLDTLGHKHVIESMLHGLREAHRATCMTPWTTLGFMRLGGRLFLTLILVTLVHHLCSDIPSLISAYAILQGDSSSSAIVLPPSWMQLSVPLFPWMTTGTEKPFSLTELFLPPEFGVPDLLCAAVAWLLLGWFERRASLLPHWRVDRRIAEILDNLSARVVVQQDGMRAASEKPFKVSMPGQARTVTTEPRDPRSLEQAFMGVLSLLRKPKLQLAPGFLLTLPAAETIFIFDELDKVGTTTTLIGGEEDGTTRTHSFNLERERSRKLQALLGDLKNLLSTAPARFFFVGGRNLHDEWLADEANRSPLLTNIFDAEIYIRSLLTDHVVPDQPPPSSTLSVARYLESQRKRAEDAWLQWKRTAGAGRRERHIHVLAPIYFSSDTSADRPLTLTLNALTQDSTGQMVSQPADAKMSSAFVDRFVEFLTFRSRGIPRRARLLLEAFVRPYDGVVPCADDHRHAQHILYFGDTDQHRIELVSELFRATETAVLRVLRRRDDKVLMAVLQFADFLSRFHQSAFSLQSLERFEELMHVHRDPDTGALAARLIEGWLGQLLEPTSAGIYAYRFRDHWSAEIGYLSRVSENESAAFNFTLDESQALKAQLLGVLADIEAQAGRYEVHVALGELNALDGDHVEARHHFRSALDAIDRRLEQEFGSPTGGVGNIQRIFDPKAARSVRRQLDWGLTRINVMLQVGVSYERTFNYPRATLEYGNAHQVAIRLFQGALTDLCGGSASAASMLFEPALALAWSGAKDPANLRDVDLGTVTKCVEEVMPGVCDAKGARYRARKGLSDGVSLQLRSRLLANIGDLVFYTIPQHRHSRRPLDDAISAYRGALTLASAAGDRALLARCLVSLALCDVVEHRYLSWKASARRPSLSVRLLKRIARRLTAARRCAYAAPSGRGSHSDSMALHLFNVELAEELAWLVRNVGAHGGATSMSGTFHDALQTLRSFSVPDEPDPQIDRTRERWLSELRRTVVADAEQRARTALNPHGPSARPSTSDLTAFPMRNRLLNLRAEVLSHPPSAEYSDMLHLLVLFEQFDQRDVLAPSRLALVATRVPLVLDKESRQGRELDQRLQLLWNVSKDIADGGKRYYALLRDRFYLEDGYGPLIVRLNFALTIGLSDIHETLRERYLRKRPSGATANQPAMGSIVPSPPTPRPDSYPPEQTAPSDAPPMLTLPPRTHPASLETPPVTLQAAPSALSR